ncbi:G1 family glutamic endopeptidase [Ktedonospora formicarum]|uniref:Uncharacterized protein n=1 Tax=Ktedonospora formicarum TaxID=2778364 RepID=A0A8J3IF42_9CHLR|nr:G1 family glutamic endopeptidase [Ktedonospora formicarum]GHO51213.1 hypothetical protein KSX_93760 [Ktedonospora formicarum]
MQSETWSGYTSLRKGVEGVRAQWIEPDVAGKPNANVYIWIGVGGWETKYHELVQIGTLAYTDEKGKTTHKVWYETLPELSQLTSMTVAPGDRIAAVMELEPGSHEHWVLSLRDVTRGTEYTKRITYSSSQVYADFIVEDPSLNSTELDVPLYPLQRFSPVRFTNAQVHYSDGWYSIGALKMLQISMEQHDEVLASPSPISLPDAFSVRHA